MNVHVTVSSCVDFDSCHEWRFGVGDICTYFLGLLQKITALEMFKTSFSLITEFFLEHAVAQFVEALPYKRVGFPMLSLEFFIDIILPAAMWPLG
jgi:hypothetical protein